jgi:very-short-patch-repair endonuclease
VGEGDEKITRRAPRAPFASPLEGEAGSPKANREGPHTRPVPPPCGGGLGRGVADMPHAAVSKQYRGRAKDLRQRMTRAETLLLWRYIKAHRIEGLGFRRQVPLGNYVADFVCHSACLIVELDGESHDFESRRKSDQKRDAWIEREGYMVLRFTNDQVLRELEGVVQVIRETASAHRGPPPSLPLPQVHVGFFRFGPIMNGRTREHPSSAGGGNPSKTRGSRDTRGRSEGAEKRR